MEKWIQYTYVNGILKYEPKERTADEMISMMANMHFLRQAGEHITVGAENDETFCVTAYTVIRVMNNRTVEMIFERRC